MYVEIYHYEYFVNLRYKYDEVGPVRADSLRTARSGFAVFIWTYYPTVYKVLQ